MDYMFISDEMLIEDDIDLYIEIQEICAEIDMFS